MADKHTYLNPNNQFYVRYNNPKEVRYLNLNIEDAGTPENFTDGVLSGGDATFYTKPPRQSSYYACYGGRNVDTHYIYGVERDTHPDYSSRFGYGRCKNGYCSGVWPGRYMPNGEACARTPFPKDMAPPRFYTEKAEDMFNVESQAIKDYNWWKNYGMNLNV